jgi:hypothetical protein
VVDLPDTPRWVAARAGVDYVSGAAGARERAEDFVRAVEAVTGLRVLRMRPLVSGDGLGSAEIEFGTGTLQRLTAILTDGRSVAADAEAGGDAAAPDSEE